MEQLFDAGRGRPRSAAVAIYNAGAYAPGAVIEIEAAEFERCWRILCLGGFLVGQRAARSMVAAGRGTILFTGATASLRGGANFANLAVGRFGLRAVAQSMARELGEGIHVAHVIIDGQIRSERYAHLEKERPPDGLLDPAAIAETYWHLHRSTAERLDPRARPQALGGEVLTILRVDPRYPCSSSSNGSLPSRRYDTDGHGRRDEHRALWRSAAIRRASSGRSCWPPSPPRW